MVGLCEDGTPAKNGAYDECVFLDSPSRFDVNDIVAGLARRDQRNQSSLFASMTLEQYEKSIRKAAAAAGLDSLNLCPHMLRCSGASHDMFHKIRGIRIFRYVLGGKRFNLSIVTRNQD